MKVSLFRREHVLALCAVLGGIAFLGGLEAIEEPDMTFGELLLELIELKGLGQAIDTQFVKWGLTEAEREIGLLLLKGLSHKEIALMRQSSERTVRRQASSIYSKASLSGRAALSSYFLEDLLPPPV
jgi:DNA-binding NarL/FixJ family response regulator